MKITKLEEMDKERMDDIRSLEHHAWIANYAKDYINAPENSEGIFTDIYNHSIGSIQKILDKYKPETSKPRETGIAKVMI